MLRSIAALTALSLASTPAVAATYFARTSAPAEGRIAARDILWTCGAQACSGSTRNSRPLVLCQGLAKQAGRIDSFAVDGRALAPADLDRCNASAKSGADTAIATSR